VKTGDGWTSEPAATTGTDTPMPGNYLDYLQGVSADVRVDGHETLHGDATTRYTASLDLERALTRIHDPARRAIVQHGLDELGVSKIPARVWLDAAGRLRKLELSIDLRAAAARLGGRPGSDPKIVESFELYDFGVPVDVQAPTGAVPAVSAQAHAIQNDLRNALTAEKVVFTDNEQYSANAAAMKQVEPSLDWGGRLTVGIGPSGTAGAAVVCLSETAGGEVFSIADVASGPRAGTYFGRQACPRVVVPETVSPLGASW
jgi:hypothetical protein